jgi:putative ABC transport system permease protein
MINVGLVKIAADASPENVAEKIRAKTWPVANAFTRSEIMAAEQNYWLRGKPIGIMFTSGLIVALIAGGVILYQVLAMEVQNRLREYATLKALGYGTATVYATVLRQALIFSGLAFVPAYLIALFLYALLRAGILLPVRMEVTRVSGVVGLTLLMSFAATFLAIRKLRRADPADLF